jgi:hypothetical protein
MQHSPAREANLEMPGSAIAAGRAQQRAPVFRPKRRTDDFELSLVELPLLAAWPRFRISLGATLLVHVLMILALLYAPRPEESVVEEITEITFEEEEKKPATRAAQRTPRPEPEREEQKLFVQEKKLQAEAGRGGPKSDERGSQKDLVTKMRETNPNAGGSSLSDNKVIDIPGPIGALNPNRPPARGAGSRSRAGAFAGGGSQIKVEGGTMRDYEATDAVGDFASNAVAAVSAFRNRPGPPGNGLGKSKYGVGVDLGKGTGAGISDGDGQGGLYGAEGGGPGLGGGGYGNRPGRGAGNGIGDGIGNGTELGIAAGLGGDGGSMSIHDLIQWMKAHPGAIPKLVQYDMEHKAGDLSSSVSFNMNGKRYELFLSCNEADVLLRICLIEGGKFTMLKDNGIKEASNYLATGDVVRAGAAIQSLITSRQAPGETAQQFYKIFWSWWEGEKR